MKVITNIITNSKFNKKAEDLGLLLRLYNKCLFPTEEAFNEFLKQVRNCLVSLNAEYPKTKPFELYSVWEYGITITVQGRPEKAVANLSLSSVKVVYDLKEDSIVPIEDYKLVEK